MENSDSCDVLLPSTSNESPPVISDADDAQVAAAAATNLDSLENEIKKAPQTAAPTPATRSIGAQRKGLGAWLQQLQPAQPVKSAPQAVNRVTETAVTPISTNTNPWKVPDGFKRPYRSQEFSCDLIEANSLLVEPFQSLRQRKHLFSTNNYVRSAKWAPSGDYLLFDSADYRARVFPFAQGDVQTASMKEVCLGGLVYDQQWHPCLDIFATSSTGHPTKLFDAQLNPVTTAFCRNSLDEIDSPYSLAFSNDGVRLYGGCRSKVYVFNLAEDREQSSVITTFRKEDGGQKGILSCIAMNPTFHGSFAVGSYNGNVGFYSEQTTGVDMLIGTGAQKVTHMQFSPNGNRLYCGYARSTVIECYDVRMGSRLLATFERPVHTNQRIYFDLDHSGRWLFSATTDAAVLIFDTEERPAADVAEQPVHASFRLQCPLAVATAGLAVRPQGDYLAVTYGQRITQVAILPDCAEGEAVRIPDPAFGAQIWRL